MVYQEGVGWCVALVDSFEVKDEVVGVVLGEDFYVDYFHIQSVASHVGQES